MEPTVYETNNGDKMIELKQGDRARVNSRYYPNIQYVVEVVKVDDKGFLADLLSKSTHGNWINVGHRFYYEWEFYSKGLEKL